MKTITLEKDLEISTPELVDVESLKSYLPENCELEIRGIGKEFKGSGHFKITLNVRLNGEWIDLKHTTTDTSSIDGLWTDEIFTEEDEAHQAECFTSLVGQVLKNNYLKNI